MKSKRFLDVCKEATNEEFENLSSEIKKEFEAFYFTLKFESQNEEDYQRYFWAIQEEWNDWLNK